MEIITAGLENQFPGLIINFVLDGSGSMQSRKKATIEAFNAYVKSQKDSEQAKRKGQIYMTLTTFNYSPKVIYACKEISEVIDLDSNTYCTDGGTALNDAIGHTVSSVETAIKDWKNKPTVLTVILTDGEENASKEYGTAAIKKVIEDKQKEGWVFVFLADNIRAETMGASMGITRGMSRRIYADNMGATMGAVAASTCCMADSLCRAGADCDVVSANFFDAAKTEWNAANNQTANSQTANQFNNLDISKTGDTKNAPK